MLLIRLGSKVKLSWKLSSILKLENGRYSLTYETPEGLVSLQSRSVVMTIPSHVASSLLLHSFSMLHFRPLLRFFTDCAWNSLVDWIKTTFPHSNFTCFCLALFLIFDTPFNLFFKRNMTWWCMYNVRYLRNITTVLLVSTLPFLWPYCKHHFFSL